MRYEAQREPKVNRAYKGWKVILGLRDPWDRRVNQAYQVYGD